jgi:hypothetical protein
MAAVLLALVLQAAGCVQVSTGRYAVNGRDVSALMGPAGSGKPIEVGSTSAATVRHTLGCPRVRYEDHTTDLFEAVPRYRWVFNPWPVVLMNQAQPGSDPRVLVRIDYDGRGVVERYDTATTTGLVIRGAVPVAAHRAWPDLRQREPAAFGMN